MTTPVDPTPDADEGDDGGEDGHEGAGSAEDLDARLAEWRRRVDEHLKGLKRT